MVTIGDVTTPVGNGLPRLRGLLLLLLRLDRLQGIALVDSGYPVVASFVEHLAHLAGPEGRREVTTDGGGDGRTGRRRRCRVGTDGGGSDCAATSDTVLLLMAAGCYRGGFGRGGRGNHLHLPLIPFLLLALLEAHLHLSKP